MNEGLKYDKEKPRTDLLSTEALVRIAEVLGYGAKKYGAQNWRDGLNWSRVIAAALRHLLAFNAGEDKDAETGLSHLAHLGCCVMFLLEYEKTHKEFDDRYREPPTPDTQEEKTSDNNSSYSVQLSRQFFRNLIGIQPIENENDKDGRTGPITFPSEPHESGCGAI